MKNMKSFRLKLAQTVCRTLPPIFALRARSFIYPYGEAQRDDFLFVSESQGGARLQGTTKDYHFYPFCVQGYYEWRNLAIAQAVIRKGDRIIEIGANIGTETVAFAEMVGASGKVHAFEPLPLNIAKLQKAVQLNQSNIVIHDCALSDRSGELQFAVPPEFSTGIGHLSHGGSTKGETIAVKCLTLDEMEKQIGRARAIFMDVEGEEVNVLRGSRGYLQKHQPHLVLEASPKLLRRAGTSLEELYETLNGLSYEIYKITRFGLELIAPAALSEQRRASNWLCLDKNSEKLADKVRRHLFKCAVLPFLFGLNPLRRVHQEF